MEVIKMLRITAYAKVNLFLEITGKLANGYHTVETVMQNVSISDTIELKITSSKSGINIFTDNILLPTDERNIAYRAASSYLQVAGMDCGVDIQLCKNIPIEAGMGGGSADGAAVILGLNELSGYLLSDEKMFQIASAIGADVPFGIYGGTQYLNGTGTQLVEKLDTPDLSMVIAKPLKGISTPAAYKYLDQMYNNFEDHIAESLEPMLVSLRNKGKKEKVSEFLFNRFEKVVPTLCPLVADLIDFMNDRSIGTLLSGSGSAVFAITEDNHHSEKLVNQIKKEYPGYYVTAANTVASGCALL